MKMPCLHFQDLLRPPPPLLQHVPILSPLYAFQCMELSGTLRLQALTGWYLSILSTVFLFLSLKETFISEIVKR